MNVTVHTFDIVMLLGAIREVLTHIESCLSDNMFPNSVLSRSLYCQIHSKWCQNACLGEYSCKCSQLCMLSMLSGVNSWERKQACNNILDPCSS